MNNSFSVLVGDDRIKSLRDLLDFDLENEPDPIVCHQVAHLRNVVTSIAESVSKDMADRKAPIVTNLDLDTEWELLTIDAFGNIVSYLSANGEMGKEWLLGVKFGEENAHINHQKAMKVYTRTENKSLFWILQEKSS